MGKLSNKSHSRVDCQIVIAVLIIRTCIAKIFAQKDAFPSKSKLRY